MSLLRYAEYKDSGVGWLGSVPAHWSVEPLKRGFAVVGGSTPKSDEASYWDGDVVWVSPADLSRLASLYIADSTRRITREGFDSCGTTLVPPGSIVLSTRAPIGSLAVATTTLCTNQGCKSLVPRNDAESLYFAYVLLSATTPLNLRGKGTTFLELSADELAAFKVPMPPRDEQVAIAAFLDRETAKIDALIAEQAKLIALLTEKRQAIISHAVTRGLDPDAPMKDSDVAWLGKVPAHWQVKQLKHLAKPGTAITYGIVQAGPHHEGGIPYIRTSDMAGDKLPLDGYALTSPEIDSSYSRSKVAAGDIVIAIRATVGKCLPLPPELAGANLTQGTAKVSPGTEVTTGFLLSSLRSAATQTYFDSMAKGATFKEITLDALRRTPVVVPPAEEQREIEAFVNVETSKLDSLRSSAEHAIDLLRERRSTLIAAAVTGQIDVRKPPEAQHLGGNDVPHAHRQGAVARQNL